MSQREEVFRALRWLLASYLLRCSLNLIYKDAPEDTVGRKFHELAEAIGARQRADGSIKAVNEL